MVANQIGGHAAIEILETYGVDLLEIVEDRYERRSTIVTSQVPVDHWYDMIGNPTLADAILDRLVHNAYRIELTGESLRKQRPLPSDA